MMNPATIKVVWHDGAGFAIYEGAGIRLTEAPPDLGDAIEVHFTPGVVARVRYYGAAARDMTEPEKDALMRRLVAMNCGAFDAWNENAQTLAVVFYKNDEPRDC